MWWAIVVAVAVVAGAPLILFGVPIGIAVVGFRADGRGLGI